MVEETKEDKYLKAVIENKNQNKQTIQLESYKKCYPELSVMNGLVLRGDRLVIPTKLRPAVLEAAHEGCPGREAMLRQLRQDTWWPGQAVDVKDFVSSCLGCTASLERNRPAPMTLRETPEGPWQHCSADFKGPIGGQYYFHVLIDNLSRWPEVEIVKSTSMEQLQPALAWIGAWLS